MAVLYLERAYLFSVGLELCKNLTCFSASLLYVQYVLFPKHMMDVYLTV